MMMVVMMRTKRGTPVCSCSWARVGLLIRRASAAADKVTVLYIVCRRGEHRFCLFQVGSVTDTVDQGVCTPYCNHVLCRVVTALIIILP